MKDNLRIGLVDSAEFEITEQMLAKNVGSGDAEVLATPVLLNMMESLCAKMIAQNQEDESFTSVGALANLSHVAPTPPGMKVNLKATVIGLDRKKVTFRIEARDEIELVSIGIHERVILNRKKFEEKASRKHAGKSA